ncbi:MAG: deoxyribodipyrimidine photolyase [Planctomycetaceae bacterium]|nr:deoxyribodipyrimidine photolyase [Planctomycetaceae bacterium]
MTTRPTIVWFRNDLRITDQPALIAAAERGPVVPVFIWAPEEEAPWEPGGASRWWLHHSLESLQQQLESCGARLILRQGESLATLQQLIEETDADAVMWCRRYEPVVIRRDKQIKTQLADSGVHVESFNGSLLHEPWTIETKQEDPYTVFTPFWKRCLAAETDREPGKGFRKIAGPDTWPESTPLKQLGLLPKIRWDRAFYDEWDVGAPAAEKRLRRFLKERLKDYKEDRNRIDIEGYSKLSPHLHFGEISPRQIWQATQEAMDGKNELHKGGDHFLSEVGWREFAHHLLFHFPHTTEQPLREKFEDFPWSTSRKRLQAWQRGQTGYPIVDAAMRGLWTTGFMANRARMVVASFLTKDLLIPWQEGARWFWDTLVDADLANNTLGWQWTAGCGADAAPYFRIFNPTSQASKFDPQGDFIRRWVPELSKLDGNDLYEPWNADEDTLRQANVALDNDYPDRLVDHSEARNAALEAYEEIKG